jgi:hypothetical protein
MTISKQILTITSVILVMISCAACRTTAPASAVTVTTIPSLTPSTPSITPSPIPIITPTPDFCISTQWQDNIRVMSQDLFTALEPGGPPVFDRIFVEKNPAWADFRQDHHGELRSAGVIFHETAFGPELGTGVNPAVLLVTYGEERNWELPLNGDLVSDVDHIRAVLHQHELDLILGNVDQSQYPPMGNAATYALYRYFNGDLSKLEDWCHTYVQIYHESPLEP